MKFKCAFCNKDEYMPKQFVCPGWIMRANQYSVCEEHQGLYLTFEGVYPDPKGRPITRHEYKVDKDFYR